MKEIKLKEDLEKIYPLIKQLRNNVGGKIKCNHRKIK